MLQLLLEDDEAKVLDDAGADSAPIHLQVSALGAAPDLDDPYVSDACATLPLWLESTEERFSGG